MIFCRSRYATSYRLLVNNKDPRLLYFFQKNDYNSNVVQAYFDQKEKCRIL